MGRNRDYLDQEIEERNTQRAKCFDQAVEKPEYTELTIKCNMSRSSLEECARRIGPSFIYNLYVPSVKLLEARNRVRECLAHVKDHPFAPHINIVETPQFEEGEWCLEANGQAFGSYFQW